MSRIGGASQPVEQPVRPIKTVSSIVAWPGDTTVIMPPGNRQRIVVCWIHLASEDATASIIRLKNGATAQRRRRFSAAGQSETWAFAEGREWRLDDAAALVLENTGGGQVSYDIDYWIEDI